MLALAGLKKSASSKATSMGAARTLVAVKSDNRIDSRVYSSVATTGQSVRRYAFDMSISHCANFSRLVSPKSATQHPVPWSISSIGVRFGASH